MRDQLKNLVWELSEWQSIGLRQDWNLGNLIILNWTRLIEQSHQNGSFSWNNILNEMYKLECMQPITVFEIIMILVNLETLYKHVTEKLLNNSNFTLSKNR